MKISNQMELPGKLCNNMFSFQVYQYNVYKTIVDPQGLYKEVQWGITSLFIHLDNILKSFSQQHPVLDFKVKIE